MLETEKKLKGRKKKETPAAAASSGSPEGDLYILEQKVVHRQAEGLSHSSMAVKRHHGLRDS